MSIASIELIRRATKSKDPITPTLVSITDYAKYLPLLLSTTAIIYTNHPSKKLVIRKNRFGFVLPFPTFVPSYMELESSDLRSFFNPLWIGQLTIP